MEKVKIGINGFGRIGRLVLRESFKRNDVEIVAINDLMEIDQLAYLLKYDSVHGTFKKEISVDGSNLIIDGKKEIYYYPVFFHLPKDRNELEVIR